MMRTSTLMITAGLLALGMGMSSCALIIPPDPSIPRNNTVIGDPHRPQLNSGSGAAAPAATPTQPQAMVPSQPPTLMAMNTPPVPSAMAATPVVTPQAEQAQLAPAPVPPQYRSVPVENEQALQMAGNYPPLGSVPPRPVMDGPESSKQHLKDARSEMESARDAAAVAKDKLDHDAAGEPSMAAPAAATPVETPAPVVAPAASTSAPAPVPAPTSSVAPVASPVAEVTSVPVPAPSAPVTQTTVAAAEQKSPSLPAGAQFAPPAPKSGAMPVAKAKSQKTPESLMGQSLPTASASPTKTAFADISVQKGDFNPLLDDSAAAAASLAGATSGR